MTKTSISTGTAHKVPQDMRVALLADSAAYAAWESLTPLARNEWICWTVSVKREETRIQHLDRMCKELKEGMRRPCCWYGCIHRTDKEVSASVRNVVLARKR